MEWNRGVSPTQPTNQPAAPAGPTHSKKARSSLLSLRTASVGLVFCIAILILAIVGLTVFGNNNTNAQKDVNTKEMQAVFLNGGQVYFGKINSVNDKTMRVSGIYYLRVNQTVQPNGNTSQNQDISLVKLGCELHGPEDSMVINQSQIIFWENLKNDGQVAKAVAQYKQQNPNGQKCDTSTNTNASTNGTSTGTSTGTNTGTATGTNTGTSTGTSTGTTTKKP